jgi:hypothetical protein
VITAAGQATARRVGPLVTVMAANAALLLLLLVGGATLVVLLLVLAGVGLLVAERPQRGILLLLALVPFDGLLLVVPHPSLAEGWKEAITIVTLGATFVAPATARAPRRRAAPAWLLPVAALFLLSVASSAVVGGLAAGLGIKIGFFYVLAAWAVWRCPLDPAERDRLVTILLGGGIVTAAYGVAQQAIGAVGLVSLGYEYNTTVRFAGGFLRSFSTFVQPFGFGFYLMTVVLVALPGALRDPGRLRSRVLFWSLPLISAAVLATIVRGAWLGLAVGVVYLAAARHRSLLILLPIALTAVLLLPSEAATSALSSSSTGERAAGWAENLHAVSRHPFGLGVGSSGAAAEKAAEVSQRSTPVYQPDNQYFLALYELGPLGLWMLALLFWAAFATSRAVARTRRGADGDLAWGVTAFVLAAAAASTVSSFLQIFPMDVLWWVLLAVVACVAAEAPEPSSTAGDRWDDTSRGAS